MIMIRVALSEESLQSLEGDASRRRLIRVSLNLVPFAGIAFLWFIGVVREQIGVAVEDRLFSTVFLGRGLRFLAMMFQIVAPPWCQHSPSSRSNHERASGLTAGR
jgi:membrane protein YqaA with SNARE-associated domain